MTSIYDLKNSFENIKIIKNFISTEECQKIIKSVESKEPSSERAIQLDQQGNPLTFKKDWDDTFYGMKYQKTVFDIIEKEYKVKIKNRSSRICQWSKNDIFDIYINDLDLNPHHDMSATIYLNDDYDGGEIYFLRYEFIVKPEAGDLIIFPGNMDYEHIIKVVNSGSKYMIPMWYTFI